MVFEEIFQYADKNNDGFLSIDEIVKLASPDIDNNNQLDSTEIEKGKKTARVWLAYMLSFDANKPDNEKILLDNKVSLVELKNHSSSQIPDLWQKDSNGNVVYDANHELTPHQSGQAFLSQADLLIG